jgi:hypothetical protein
VVTWKPGTHSLDNDDDQDWFCSETCWRSFWDAHDHWRSIITDLEISQARDPEYWRGLEDSWQEQYEVCWWQLARYVGVRRGGTKSAVAKWHEFYFEMGRAIARAAEAEQQLEFLLELLVPDSEPGDHRGRRAKETLDDLRKNAYRWPHAEGQIHALCDAAEEGQEKRNWLVHAQVIPSIDGLRVSLVKPTRKQPDAKVEEFRVEQINRIAARFVWVSKAVMYAINTSADGRVPFIDPLGPAPAVEFDWSPRELQPDPSVEETQQ